MIEIIFSYLNRLKNRLQDITEESTVDVYGAGELGNVCYCAGISEENIPTILKWDKVFNNNTVYPIPFTRAAHFQNLYIDTGVTLQSYGESAVIVVNDTLYLRGAISCSNVHSGNYYYTPNMPQFLPKLQVYAETNFLPNTQFCITGGTGNPMFGNHSLGGGLCAVYYTDLLSLASSSDTTDTSDVPNLYTHANVRGGTGSGLAGGCLIIAARNIAISSTGNFECYGGDGTGTNASGVFLPLCIDARTNLIE